MQAQKLQALLHIVQHMDDLILDQIATLPAPMMRDNEDRTLVAVARGEQDWRVECHR